MNRLEYLSSSPYIVVANRIFLVVSMTISSPFLALHLLPRNVYLCESRLASVLAHK